MMMRAMTLAALGAVAGLAQLWAAPALAEGHVPCGREAACEIADGSYHLMAPPDWDGTTALPALVFYHGHRSSGASVFRSAGLKNTFLANGYMIIAPNGALRPGTNIRAWPARPTATGRDDVAFTLAVVEDAAAQVPILRDKVYVAGFSAGGSMAWMMACYAGERFAGFASVAGALRRPIPDQTCPGGPVSLLQVHGFGDTQVPLEGRGIGNWHQGDVFEAFSLARRTNGCRTNPDQIALGEPFRCRIWTSCEAGGLKMCLHDGGHGLPRGWTDLARDWFEAPPTE